MRRQERDRVLVVENETGDAVARRLSRFPDARDLGLVISAAEGLDLFPRTPQSRFDGRTALELMAAGEAAGPLGALQ